jgi:Mlc titration factor MtfA (ptsG expression regulator)
MLSFPPATRAPSTMVHHDSTLVVLLLTGGAAALALAVAAWQRRRRSRREQLRQRPFPSAWRRMLERNVPWFRSLAPTERRALEGGVLIFLDEIGIEGCSGLTMTDEMRVTVAGCAALLIFKRPGVRYERLKTVLLYPETFAGQRLTHMGSGVSVETSEERSGESWRQGTVILVWAELERAIAERGPYQPALHEFAHQLDTDDGAADGVPALPNRRRYQAWTAAFEPAFHRLQRDAETGQGSVFNPYGATNEAEFFAVATETFFGTPEALQSEQPAVYAQLRALYGLDPARLGQ